MKALRFLAGITMAISMVGLTACGGMSEAKTIADKCVPEWEFPTLEKGKLKMAAMVSPPFIDVRPGSKEGGMIEGELLALFAERSCLEPVYEALDGTAVVAAITEGRADIANGGWYRTEARGKTMGQTEPYLYEYNALLSKEGYDSIDDLKGKIVGVQTGSLYIEPLSQVIGAQNVRQFTSVDAIVRDIEAGRVDASLTTENKTKYQLKAAGRSDDLQLLVLKPNDQYPVMTQPGQSNWLHPKTNTSLTKALDSFIADISTDGTLRETAAKYGITSDLNFSAAARAQK